MKITVPTSLNDITWGDYLKYKAVMKAEDITEDFEKLALVTIFCRISVPMANSMSKKDLDETANQINRVLDFKPQFTQRFEMDGKEFGFIPNLDKMSAGEYIDLDKYFGDEETYTNALAILYRPIQGKFGKDLYNIEKYESSEKYAEQMLNANLNVALGVTVFFYRLSAALLKSMKAYLQLPETMKILQEADSSINGDGIKASLQSLEAMSSGLTKLQNYQYMNSLRSSNSRLI